MHCMFEDIFPLRQIEVQILENFNFLLYLLHFSLKCIFENHFLFLSMPIIVTVFFALHVWGHLFHYSKLKFRFLNFNSLFVFVTFSVEMHLWKSLVLPFYAYNVIVFFALHLWRHFFHYTKFKFKFLNKFHSSEATKYFPRDISP